MSDNGVSKQLLHKLAISLLDTANTFNYRY
jgi:hypothetical protein